MDNTAKRQEFEHFFTELNSKSLCYHAKTISNKFDIPHRLLSNIENYSNFLDTFSKLVSSKLYIWCVKGFNPREMFKRYILPTSVFLYYMHVDITKLSEINIYIVDSELYNTYNPNIGGEYIEGRDSKTKIHNHLIFIKDYKLNVMDQWKDSLTSLFHELTHLIDNIRFDGFKDEQEIDYLFRWHEIKARYLSEFFCEFYKMLSNRINEVNDVIPILKENLLGLSESIESILYFNNEIINIELDRSNHTDLFYCSHQNIQYYKSMQEIDTINKFLNNVEEILVK